MTDRAVLLGLLAGASIVRDRVRRDYDAGTERRSPTLDELLADPSLADALPAEERDRLIRAMAALTLRLLSAASPAAAPARPALVAEPDDLIDVERVCEITHMTRRQVFNAARRVGWKPFVVRVNARVLRFRERGLRRWIVCQTRPNT